MFGTAGQASDPVLSTSPNWRDIDKDVARLVGDYDGPRATSAPPQFDDRWAARVGNTNSYGTGNEGRWTPADGLADIRLDEDYEKFYTAQLGTGRKLPPPVDNRTLYSELPLHIQQSYTPQQQAALNARLSPAPKAYLGTGLDSISEQRPSPAPPNAGDISPTMLQAFSQLALQWQHSPAPPGIPQSIGDFSLHTSQNGTLNLPQSGAPLAYTPSQTPPPPSHTPPLGPGPAGNPASPGHAQHAQGQALAANAAAVAAAAATGQGRLPHMPPPPMPPPPPPGMNLPAGNVAGMLEYQAAYQAAYHAALQQQAAAMLQHSGGGGLGPMGQFGGSPGGLLPQAAAAQLAGPAFFSNPSVTSAAAAAAASAVQNIMSGGARGT